MKKIKTIHDTINTILKVLIVVVIVLCILIIREWAWAGWVSPIYHIGPIETVIESITFGDLRIEKTEYWSECRPFHYWRIDTLGGIYDDFDSTWTYATARIFCDSLICDRCDSVVYRIYDGRSGALLLLWELGIDSLMFKTDISPEDSLVKIFERMAEILGETEEIMQRFMEDERENGRTRPGTSYVPWEVPGGCMPQKTKYKYIYFEKNPHDNTWWCVDTKDDSYIGWVDYYERWKQFCFYPQPATVLSQDCLEDIIDFIKQLRRVQY